MSRPEPIILPSTVPVGRAPLSPQEVDLLNGAATAAIHFLHQGAIDGRTANETLTTNVQAIEEDLTAECRVILERQIHKPVRSFEIKYLYRHDDGGGSEASELSSADQEICYVQIDAVVAKDWRKCLPLYPFAASFATFCVYLAYETVVMPFTPAEFDVAEAACRWWIIRGVGILSFLIKGGAQIYDTKLRLTHSNNLAMAVVHQVGQKACALCHWIEDFFGVRHLIFNVPVEFVELVEEDVAG